MKRQRGRGRKPGNPGNRSFESNGPEVKIRGNATQIHDKYLQLARDASSSGDRVRAENLYQHAEHYYRIIQANQPKRDPNQDEANANAEGQDNASSDAEGGEDGQAPQRENRRGRGRRNERQQRDPMEVVTPEGEKTAGEGEQPSAEGDAEEEAPRRRTRRPRRPRPDADADSNASADAETALETASAKADADAGGDGDGSESEAA